MRFLKLRLSGFKSFVDPTELALEQGITAIVGPNGCGKSNLVEALRWVMGESQARRLRGGDMDDVIFGGTVSRPPRNIAEVSLQIDNSARTAPAGFNTDDTLDIVRRIARDKGSDFRLNNRPVRVRDIQTLLQDNGAGASSVALVSQGSVGALINARPGERRRILEEAAGVAGLHARRQEAEGRLKAAEENLSRTETVLNAARSRIDGLRRQARQAEKYRRLSAQIRHLDHVLIHRRWTDATSALATARKAYADNESAIAEAMVALDKASTAQSAAESAIAPLKKREAEIGAAVQRLVVDIDRLDRDAEKVADTRRTMQNRLSEIDRDAEREKGLMADADAATAALSAERDQLRHELDRLPSERDAADAALQRMRATLQDEEESVGTLTATAATAEASLAAAKRRVAEREAELQRLTARLVAARSSLETAESAGQQLADPAPPADRAQRLEAAIDQARSDADAARQNAEVAEESLRRAETEAADADAPVRQLEAEAAGLRSILGHSAGETTPGHGAESGDTAQAVFERLTVEPGFETAAPAALGDGIRGALNAQGDHYWRDLPPMPASATMASAVHGDFVSEALRPLASAIQGPAAISRRLAACWVAETLETALACQHGLAAGHRIVTVDGAVVDWDGYVRQGDAPAPEAALLKHRNRLADIESEITRARRTQESAQAQLETARAAVAEARQRDRAARDALEQARTDARTARDAATAAERDHERYQARITTAKAAVQEAQDAVAEAESAAVAARLERDEQDDPTAIRSALDTRRKERDDARRAVERQQEILQTLDRRLAGKKRRVAAIGEELHGWDRRGATAAERVADVDRRAADCRTTLADLEGRPEAIAAERESLAERLEAARADQRQAADAVAAAEDQVRQTATARRDADHRLADLKETRARLEGDVRHARDLLTAIREQAEEKIGMPPESPPPPVPPEAAATGDGAATDEETDSALDVSALAKRGDDLRRERDAMGPVNLRAETDLAEALQSIETMEADRDDIQTAIARLRDGIASLDRDARARLTSAFKEVDAHFQKLFSRLFGGGSAALKLTDMDDPLSSGLEIFASPPGKRLQHLSLLSGGEQALTALALLFSVFLTRPAPICVLDEVDAPLDDANVDRLCALLQELADQDLSRFVMVTHHRLTMAKAHRLYGVTMREQGISTLVSLDLGRAEALRQPELALA